MSVPKNAIAQAGLRHIINCRLRTTDRSRGNDGETGVQVRISDAFQVPSHRLDRADSGQALLRVIVMLLQMLLYQRFQ